MTSVGRLRSPRGRGELLLFFALLDLLYALRMLYPPDPLGQQLAWPQTLMPLWAWAVLWAAVGLACLVGAFCTHDAIPFTAAVMLKLGWGVVTLMGWLAGRIDGGYVQALIWIGAAYFVFRVAGGIPGPAGRPPREA